MSLGSWAALGPWGLGALEPWGLGVMGLGLGPCGSKSQDSVSEASGLGEVPGWVADCDRLTRLT